MSNVRTVWLASPRSWCAGVERAIETVERALDRASGPVYVRKQIVHNTHVVAELADRGAIFVDELAEIPDPPPEGAVVVFSAHGVSPAVHAEAGRRSLEVIDATCPLVTKVHAEARRFAARGHTVVLIGHDGHEETEGTMGQAPEQTVLVEDPSDVERLRLADPGKVAFLTQTTLAVDETEETIEALRARFPDITGPGAADICYATTNRQQALSQVADEADVVLVIGSANSSNSVRLAELARRQGTPAHLVEDASAIDESWLADAAVVGVTAGASAPPRLVDEVLDRLRALGPIQVRETGSGPESVRFALPRPVRGTEQGEVPPR